MLMPDPLRTVYNTLDLVYRLDFSLDCGGTP